MGRKRAIGIVTVPLPLSPALSHKRGGSRRSLLAWRRYARKRATFTNFSATGIHDMADRDKTLKARLPRGGADGRDHQAGLRALRIRAGGNAAHRIQRRARQVSPRPGPAERGRVFVSR